MTSPSSMNNQADQHRVAITGMGVICPLGNNANTVRYRLLRGESVAAPIARFDASKFITTFAAQIPDSDFIPHPIFDRDRKIAFALHAAQAAMADAGLESLRAAHGHQAGGACLGVGLELFSMQDAFALRHEKPELSGRHPLAVMQTPSDICLHLISKMFDLHQPPLIHVSACAASTDAIGMAARMIASGERSWVLAGGTDSMINPMGVAGFCSIQAMSTRNDTPLIASRPFDRQRDGFVLGEGAGMLVLENRAQAIRRGARIHGEILGYGNSFDAYSISDPHPTGKGAASAIQLALANAHCSPEEIAFVSAHGTSTPKNDIAETQALHQVFGQYARQLAISATKSMLGHCISASGAVELVSQIACGHPDTSDALFPQPSIPGTINVSDPDPDCDLDYLTRGSRPLPGSIGIKNSFGFGGQNACLVFRIGSS